MNRKEVESKEKNSAAPSPFFPCFKSSDINSFPCLKSYDMTPMLQRILF